MRRSGWVGGRRCCPTVPRYSLSYGAVRSQLCVLCCSGDQKILTCRGEGSRPIFIKKKMSVPSSHRTPPQQIRLRQKRGTHSHQLRQPTNTLMRHKLILHKRESRSDSTSRKIRRQSVKAHCEEDRIATTAGPVQRVCGTRRGCGYEADVVVVVDCCAGCCAVEFMVCGFC